VRSLFWIWWFLIYLTVPVARDALAYLREAGLLPWFDQVLKVGLLSGALAAGLWLVKRGPQALPFLGFLIFLVWWTWQLPFPEEKVHLFEYVVLGYLAIRTFGSPWKALALVFLAGVGDEVFQYFWPNRVFDPRDIFLNTLSGSGGVWFGYFSSASS